MFDTILIANRGEIAVRVLRTAHAMGMKTVAVYSEADADAPHVRLATAAVCVGGAAVAESYLNRRAIIGAALAHGAQAIHPGYGLLSESAEFAQECEAAGIVFVGPRVEHLRQFGLKHTARELALASGVPLVPGTGLLETPADALHEAAAIGYPVMLKSTAGGGGIGMQICADAEELVGAFEKVQRLGRANFGQGGVFLEKYVGRARHLEVQVFGDGQGGAVSLGVRDCSAQRRNQKVIEETPACGVPAAVLDGLQEAAVKLARSVGYRSAGTVEFIYDVDTQAFYFLEVNTRLQVEHGVTEMVQGVDLVEWMFRLAASELPLPLEQALPAKRPGGHSIQARIYAENPRQNFQPASGLLSHVDFPQGVRCDTWVTSGTEVSAYYDPLLAKLIVHAPDRVQALAALETALEQTGLYGIETNREYLLALVRSPLLRDNRMTTQSLGSFAYESRTFDVLKPGTQTTVQDYPGRLGYWDVGVPPSGPMDSLSFRLGNSLLGNAPDAAGLEITAHGPKLCFNFATRIVLSGAQTAARLNGVAVRFWEVLAVAAGDVLDIGRISDAGMRAYLCVEGGLDVADYLGSQSTFTLGQFGGHGGRPLRLGDVIHVRAAAVASSAALPKLPASLRPQWSERWNIRVLYGPHGAPDFFTAPDIETFFRTDWEVHFNSARTGVRLIGPKPQWARRDGGEAGLHPSNIHDNAYAIGAIDFTGDMPVILGPDGPSLGGFVCPATIAAADLWKMGQLRPGDKVRFECISQEQAVELWRQQEALVASVHGGGSTAGGVSLPANAANTAVAPAATAVTASDGKVALYIPTPAEAILLDEGQGDERWVVRQSGDDNLLIEFGPPVLSLRLRFAVHVLYERLRAQALPGVVDLTPGIRSLQIHFDSHLLSRRRVLDWVLEQRASLTSVPQHSVPSRTVYLPLSWNDPATQLAVDRYVKSVRADAPWCPDNLEFIRRINGLDSVDKVRDIVFDASYVVLGLGDVYLGAPVAIPLDPRHRLVTTKYNPARTWTPENAVGIGGTYMCVYGMEGPGGYQFVGRTLQMWNRYGSVPSFENGTRWLLRFFDQIRFFPVSADELLQIRHDFPRGRYDLRIDHGTFSLAEHEAMLAANEASIAAFKTGQQDAFEQERARWNAADQRSETQEPAAEEEETPLLPAGSEPLESSVAGSLCKLLVREGDSVQEGQPLLILEAMKMEITLESPCAGTVCAVVRQEGHSVKPGDVLLGVRPA